MFGRAPALALSDTSFQCGFDLLPESWIRDFKRHFSNLSRDIQRFKSFMAREIIAYPQSLVRSDT